MMRVPTGIVASYAVEDDPEKDQNLRSARVLVK
jgi:hypothetical protein